MSEKEMFKEMFLVSINNTYTEEEIYKIFYKKDGTEKSIKEMYESLMLDKLGKRQMILIGIQPGFEHASPAIFHVEDIGEERKHHYLIDGYYIPEKHDKWKQGDILEIIIKRRDPISDKGNTWIEIEGEIRNLSLEERKTE